MAPAFSQVFVWVRDIAETHRFYVELLGLEVLVGEPGHRYMRVGGGNGAYFGFEVNPEAAIPTPGIEMRVRVDDVDATYERLRAAGVEFEGLPADQTWGDRHAWLRDPSGYRLSIYSPVRG